MASGKLFDDLGLPPLSVAEDRAMICGSMDMLRDTKVGLGGVWPARRAPTANQPPLWSSGRLSGNLWVLSWLAPENSQAKRQSAVAILFDTRGCKNNYSYANEPIGWL